MFVEQPMTTGRRDVRADDRVKKRTGIIAQSDVADEAAPARRTRFFRVSETSRRRDQLIIRLICNL